MIIIIVSFHNRSSHKWALLQVTSKHWRPPGGCHCICSWAGEILAFLWLFFFCSFISQPCTRYLVPWTWYLVPCTWYLMILPPNYSAHDSRVLYTLAPGTTGPRRGGIPGLGRSRRSKQPKAFASDTEGSQQKPGPNIVWLWFVRFLTTCAGAGAPNFNMKKDFQKYFLAFVQSPHCTMRATKFLFLQWASIWSII